MCQADMQACDHEPIEMEQEGSRSSWDGEKYDQMYPILKK